MWSNVQSNNMCNFQTIRAEVGRTAVMSTAPTSVRSETVVPSMTPARHLPSANQTVAVTIAVSRQTRVTSRRMIHAPARHATTVSCRLYTICTSAKGVRRWEGARGGGLVPQHEFVSIQELLLRTCD